MVEPPTEPRADEVRLDGRWEANTAFNFEGIVPFAYALFALGLALALGTLTRRVSVLVGGTLIGFLALRRGARRHRRTSPTRAPRSSAACSGPRS